MTFSYDGSRQGMLPLMGGVVQAQRLVVPPEVVINLSSWRHACRLAWKLRNPRITQATLAELVPELYQSHVSEYFSAVAVSSKGKRKRELPARVIGLVEAIIGNTVMSQWVAQQSKLTVLEEMQAARQRRAA
jgi:hypothetical protein